MAKEGVKVEVEAKKEDDTTWELQFCIDEAAVEAADLERRNSR